MKALALWAWLNCCCFVFSHSFLGDDMYEIQVSIQYQINLPSGCYFFPPIDNHIFSQKMDPEAARTARELLDLVFHMSNILETGLDRHTLSILIALCEMGLNPESLAAVLKELQKEPQASSSSTSPP
ncbi:mitotic-spindle organizing protein 1B-like isoform X2 [Henckelia pumila]|uniref:mitotic-spindle organizing protein 1B-like isoform X2 n=1 Tax=Henckelia pumila TaxID=405737 RepID=UPI003C6E186D